jgi:hypothetical protein
MPASAASTIEVSTAKERALRDAISEVTRRRKGGDQSPVELVLAAGVYRLTAPIKLDAETIGDGLTLRAEPRGSAELSGAARLNGPRRQGQVWRYPVNEELAGQGRPTVLLVDGKLRTPARHPNVGYFRVVEAAPDRRSGFSFAAGTLPKGFELSAGACDLVFFHDWSSSRLPVKEIDSSNSFLATVGPIGCSADHYAIDHFEKHPRYFLEGHPEFADVVGEWFFDGEQQEIVLVAASSEPPVVEWPRLEQLLIASSEQPDAQPVENLKVEGLKFTGTKFPMPPGGLAGAQATMHEPRDERGERITTNRPMLSAAVHLEYTRGLQLKHCEFYGIGNTALWVGSRARQSVISECRFQDLGGNAINFGENNDRRVDGRSWYQAAPQQVPSENRIVDCSIERCGELLSGSVAIWAALNHRLEIARNRIHDCPYTGISLGWIWSQAESPAGKNHVHHNQIARVMQVLSDGGGVYTLGRQLGSRIEENVIENVPLNLGRAESNGMFLDEGTSGFEVTGNRFRRIAKSPLRFHRAGQNLVRRNEWELETEATPPVRYNNTPEDNIRLEGNVVLEKETRIFLIGNSLTWDTRPQLLDEYVDWHVDCGKSLKFIAANPESPCVDSSRLWPIALSQLDYDYLVVQPHYGTSLTDDVDVISKWIEMQPNAVVVIHTGWARNASFEEEFASKELTAMQHSPAYFAALMDKLRSRYPERNFRQTHATEVLHDISEAINAGRSPLESLQSLYRDAIHMTHDEGRYLMHNLMRIAVDQEPSEQGFKIATEAPELKQFFDEFIRRVSSQSR